MMIDRLNKSLHENAPTTKSYVMTEFICEHLFDIPSWTIKELASQCDVSEKEMKEHIKGLGYEDYNSLKKDCKEYVKSIPERRVLFAPGVSLSENIENMTNNVIRNIQFSTDHLGQDQLRKLARDVIRSKRIFIFAQGYTRPLAHLLRTELMLYGKEVILMDQDLQEAYNPDRNDIMIVLSIIGQAFVMHPSIKFKAESYRTNRWLITCNEDIDFEGKRLVLPVQDRDYSEFVMKHVLDLLLAFIQEEE